MSFVSFVTCGVSPGAPPPPASRPAAAPELAVSALETALAAPLTASTGPQPAPAPAPEEEGADAPEWRRTPISPASVSATCRSAHAQKASGDAKSAGRFCTSSSSL